MNCTLHPIQRKLVHYHVHLHGDPDATNHVLDPQPVDAEIHPLASDCMEAIKHNYNLLRQQDERLLLGDVHLSQVCELRIQVLEDRGEGQYDK